MAKERDGVTSGVKMKVFVLRCTMQEQSRIPLVIRCDQRDDNPLS